MADPAWPFQCPTSWQEKSRTATLRSEVENGVAKTRARFTKSYLEISASWIFETWADRTAFRTFFLTDLNDGAKIFTMKHPMTGEIIRVRFREPPAIQAGVASKPTFSLEATLEEVIA